MDDFAAASVALREKRQRLLAQWQRRTASPGARAPPPTQQRQPYQGLKHHRAANRDKLRRRASTHLHALRMRRALRAWRAAAAEKVAHRCAIAKAVAYWHKGGLIRTFRRWKGWMLEQRARRAAAASHFARTQQKQRWRAFTEWRRLLLEARQRKRKAQQLLGKWRGVVKDNRERAMQRRRSIYATARRDATTRRRLSQIAVLKWKNHTRVRKLQRAQEELLKQREHEQQLAFDRQRQQQQERLQSLEEKYRKMEIKAAESDKDRLRLKAKAFQVLMNALALRTSPEHQEKAQVRMAFDTLRMFTDEYRAMWAKAERMRRQQYQERHFVPWRRLARQVIEQKRQRHLAEVARIKREAAEVVRRNEQLLATHRADSQRWRDTRAELTRRIAELTGELQLARAQCKEQVRVAQAAAVTMVERVRRHCDATIAANMPGPRLVLTHTGGGAQQQVEEEEEEESGFVLVQPPAHTTIAVRNTASLSVIHDPDGSGGATVLVPLGDGAGSQPPITIASPAKLRLGAGVSLLREGELQLVTAPAPAKVGVA